MQNGHAFDVATVLGIGTPDDSALPEAQGGETVLRVSEGFSLVQLCDSAVGKELMGQRDWFGDYDWANRPIDVGVYRLRVAVPGSCGKAFPEQRALLSEEEAPAPPALVAAALLCFQQCGQPDPLERTWTRCSGLSSDGHRVAFAWYMGRVYAHYYPDEERYDGVGLSALRTAN